MISKTQAFEILNYVIPKITKHDTKLIIREATDRKSIGNEVNEKKLWDLIMLSEENKKFITMRGISNIEELALAQFEWKMRHQWGVYRCVKYSSEYNPDDADSSDFID